MTKNIVACAAFLAAIVSLDACSDNKTETTTTPADAGGGHVSPYPSCQTILDKCHELDVGEGPIHDCHELGHGATNDSECAAQKAHCLSICVETDGGAADAADGG